VCLSCSYLNLETTKRLCSLAPLKARVWDATIAHNHGSALGDPFARPADTDKDGVETTLKAAWKRERPSQVPHAAATTGEVDDRPKKRAKNALEQISDMCMAVSTALKPKDATATEALEPIELCHRGSHHFKSVTIGERVLLFCEVCACIKEATL
jgi:hypothetical protein